MIGAARRALAAAALLALATAAGAAGEVMLYRGEFVYVIPQALADRMLGLASRGAWTYFPNLTRHIDADEDGVPDFVTIALGDDQGYGVQVRYRLRHDGRARLGRWYWCVMTDADGRKVFERFNQ